jgi:hypothetical protein
MAQFRVREHFYPKIGDVIHMPGDVIDLDDVQAAAVAHMIETVPPPAKKRKSADAGAE